MESRDLTGAILDGRYRVIEAIAQGAMGVVYRAERLKLGKIVAVKVLHDELPDELSSRKRFEIEAMAMARLEHPHCAAVLDVGVHEGKPFVVMDFISGEDLKTLIDKGPVPIGRAVSIVRQVLSGLAHAHELGIVHRDIKPANIILGQKTGLGDHVKILDFGLARLQAEQTSKLTTGIVVGTPAYMAPEQIRGTQIDARCDLYACGVLLFELLTGKKPFSSAKDDPLEVVSMHLKQAVPHLGDRKPGVSFGDLDAVIQKAMQKSAADRYQSATELVAALDAALKSTVSPTGSTELAAPAVTDAQISDSMMIPQGGTRLGLGAHPGAGSGPIAMPDVGSGPNVGGAPNAAQPKVSTGPAHPIPDLTWSVPAPESGPSTDSTAVPPTKITGSVAALGNLGRSASATPLPKKLDPNADPHFTVSSQSTLVPYPVGDGGPDPLAQLPPQSLPASPKARWDWRALRDRVRARSFTRKQLAIAGGGLLVLISIIAAIAGGGGTSAEQPETTVASGSNTSSEIEMPPDNGADAAQRVIAQARELIANGENEAAINFLTKSRVAFPDNAEMPYMAGRLYFTKLWWTDGLKQFRDVIRNDPSYKLDPELIKTVLKGFITTPSYNPELADFLREDIGAAAEEYLAETAREHPNASIRARASAELKRYQP